MMWTQLGGDSFVKRTGAKNLIASDRSLQFAIPQGVRWGINRVRITLNRHGAYDMMFYRVSGFKICVRATALDVQPDNFQLIFFQYTGLAHPFEPICVSHG
jgi:hypothetical protein